MKVSEVMHRGVVIAGPGFTLRTVATMMAQDDIGSLLIAQDDRIVGIVTDRDIALRGVGQGLEADAAVAEVMSTQIKYCYEDEQIEHVAWNMSDLKVKRLPVLDRSKRLVGILSLGDLAQADSVAATQRLLRGVTRH